ncbi:MAG: hypothetical protein IT378_06555 [Sandaracinaceae bacterium]|nr:hypothetical protein [Sandaracinaceae bacterium]
MRQTRTLYALYFITGFLVAVVATLAPRADALWTKYHPTACFTSGVVVDGNGAVGPDTSTGAGTLYCPFHDSDRLRPQAINGIYIDIYDNSSTYNVSASACVKYFNAVGGACGPSFSSSGTPGNTNLILNRSGTNELTEWTSSTASHYAYVFTTMQSNLTDTYGFTFQE